MLDSLCRESSRCPFAPPSADLDLDKADNQAAGLVGEPTIETAIARATTLPRAVTNTTLR